IVRGLDLPKAGDFPAWNDCIANDIALGPSAEHARAYRNGTGDRAWRLVNWLTHATNATRSDAELGVSATSHVISNYALTVLKKRIGAPERCGRCNSHKITLDWRPGSR